MMEAAGSLEISLHFQYHTSWHHIPQALSSYVIIVKILMAHSCSYMLSEKKNIDPVYADVLKILDRVRDSDPSKN